MKKILAIFIALSMVIGCGTMAFAEEAATEEATEAVASETPELNWADFEKEIADKEAWAGDFVTFDEIAVKMYVPQNFEAVELTDEDREEGYIAYYVLGEDAAVGVMYVSVDGMTLEEYQKAITEQFEIKDVQPILINGIEALTYTNPDDESIAYVAYATEMGCILEFSFSPVTEEGFAAVATVMMASIQPEEEAEE